MKKAEQIAERIGRAARDRVLARIEARAAEVLPSDVTVETGNGELRLTGRRFAERAMTDTRLRALGMLVREGAR